MQLAEDIVKFAQIRADFRQLSASLVCSGAPVLK
jgi:hypothetical protein